ncbi:hypothetical protein [Escherichia coli]|uniref:hypothetical protein n=1 Tax=Escherichia coli TaxID=562 RepID=UPI0030141C92
MTTPITKEQLIARIETQKETALKHPECSVALMDLEIANIARAAMDAEPVAYIPRNHIERYLSGTNSGCWVYGARVNEDDKPLFRAPFNTVTDRQAIISRVHGLCSRLPGATYANAAEFTLDEIADQAVSADPVAWQFKSANGNWISIDSDGAKQAVSEGCEIRRLYAAPPASVVDAEPVADVVAWHKEGEERTCDIRWRRFDVAPGPLFSMAQPVMKDHQIRELVNELRDIAVEYHSTQQLRERIARTVRAAMLEVNKS